MGLLKLPRRGCFWATCIQKLFLALRRVRAQAGDFLHVQHAGEDEWEENLLPNDPAENVCNVWTPAVMLHPG